MLARRLQRRPNIEPTLVQCLVFAGIPSVDIEPVGTHLSAHVIIVKVDEWF